LWKRAIWLESGGAASTGEAMVQWFAKADRALSSQPAALEVGVEVSGTHAAGEAGTRELFSEETLTTLVFEDGVVVRLTAAVADGQLLFLKHLESQKEIVTRVLRQRALGLANAYVELEFTEAAPDFWGSALELARSGASASSATDSPAEVEAREFLASDKPDQESHAPTPDEEEVAFLREEIAALRAQMGSLLEASPAPTPVEMAVPPDVATADMSSVITTLLGAPPSAPAARKTESREEFSGGEESTSETTIESLPGHRVVMPWRLIAAIIALAFLSGVASQKGLLSEWFGKRRLTVSASAALAASRGTAGVPARSKSVSASSPAPAGTAGPTKQATTDAASSDASATISGHETLPTNVSMREGATREVTMHDVTMREVATQQANDRTAESRPDRSSTDVGAADVNAVSVPVAAEEAYQPPSLVKSVKTVPPAEALRGFVTGDVKCDALIDATGKVVSATVVSGPAVLRGAAIEALRKYEYKAATRNGQPVAGHVMATVKFWYEP
jgi:hypothetical protein